MRAAIIAVMVVLAGLATPSAHAQFAWSTGHLQKGPDTLPQQLKKKQTLAKPKPNKGVRPVERQNAKRLRGFAPPKDSRLRSPGYKKPQVKTNGH